jgi:hypothetical protein
MMAVTHRMTPKLPATTRYMSRVRIGLRKDRLKPMAMMATDARKLAAAMAKRINVGTRLVLAGQVIGSSPLRRSKEMFPLYISSVWTRVPATAPLRTTMRSRRADRNPLSQVGAETGSSAGIRVYFCACLLKKPLYFSDEGHEVGLVGLETIYGGQFGGGVVDSGRSASLEK